MVDKLILRFAAHFLLANTKAFFGIGMGPSKGEQQQSGDLGSLANFATSQGEGDISSADNFWKSILSGDPTQISKVLGPETSAINKQAQQQKKTASEFGNRGGGTNAAMQSADDNTRTSYDSLVSSLTGNAASALGASGSSLLSTGLSGHEAAFSAADVIHQQKAAQLNDIFKSISSIAASIFAPGSGFASLFKKATAAPSAGGGDTGPTGGQF